jgi:hypothetical protein
MSNAIGDRGLGLQSIAAALGAAALFGASTPVAKAHVADVHPVVLAGLLYVGNTNPLAPRQSEPLYLPPPCAA